MANYTIFGTGAPSGVSASGDATEQSMSTAFYVLGVSGWRCAGVRIWIPAGTTLGGGTKIAYLWTGSGNSPTSVIATANFSSFVAGAWNTALFSSPVNLIAGKYYWAQVYLPEGGYAYKAAQFVSSVSSVETGSLYGASTGEVSAGNGTYVYGAAGQAPSLTGGATWYGVDVVVDDGTGGSIGPGSDDNVGIADAITVVRSGLPTAINASGTATDTTGLAASDTATFPIGGATAFHTERRTLNEIRVSWGAISNTNVKGPAFALESTPLTLGLEFKVLWPCRFAGCNIYKHPDAYGSIPVRLWDRQGSGGAARELGLTTITWVADAGGWREVLFSPQINLVPDVTYTVTYYSPSGYFSHQPYVFYVKSMPAPPIVVAPFRSETQTGGSSFRPGTSQVIPELYSPSDYYFDPIVEYDSTDPIYIPDGPARSYYDQWPNGKAVNKIVFGVFYADPPFLAEYMAMGVNSLIGAPGTDLHCKLCAELGMEFYPDVWLDTDGPQHVVITNIMNDPALAAVVKGYYIIDEPDQFHPFQPPEVLRAWCNEVRMVDATRPLYMGLGGLVSKNQSNTHQPQGSTMDVANDLWRRWAQLGDTLSGDWYNMSPNYDPEETYGVWTYPVFVRRLQTLNEGRTPIILAVETTSQTPNYPVPDNVRKAMWAAAIQGVAGFELFDHRFANSVVGNDFAHMLHNPPMKSMMTALIARMNSLADAILGPNTHLVTAWTSSNTTSGPLGGTWGVPMHFTTRADDDYEYLFAMGIRPGSTTATFTIPTWAGETLTVIDEGRTVTVSGAGVLTDDFPADYTVHLYRKG